MRLRSLVAVAALALLAAACGPPRHHGPGHGGPGCDGSHHEWMSQGCGTGSCTYRGHCFSEGAARSNDGVCQACNGGRWTAAEGCRDHGCCDRGGCCGQGGCKGKGKGKDKMPCMEKHEKHRGDRQP